MIAVVRIYLRSEPHAPEKAGPCGKAHGPAVLSLLRSLHRLRLIYTEWLFCHVVSASCKSASPASHADIFKFAAPALAGEQIILTKIAEHFRVRPDIGERLLAQIASQRRKISARE